MNIPPLPWWIRVLAFVFGLFGLFGCSPAADDPKPPKPTCEASCDRVVPCDNDPEPGCVDTCEGLRALCPSEVRAVIECGLAAPESALRCNADGFTELRDSACPEAFRDLQACLGNP